MAEQNLPQPKHDNQPTERIGSLVATPDGKHAVVGLCCPVPADLAPGVPLYRINVQPYRATCVVCGRTVLQGLGGARELFDGTLRR